MSAKTDKIKVTVRFPCGSITMSVPFWVTDTGIIRKAIDGLPACFDIRPEDCSVERVRP